jgi:hypothetical protein
MVDVGPNSSMSWLPEDPASTATTASRVQATEEPVTAGVTLIELERITRPPGARSYCGVAPTGLRRASTTSRNRSRTPGSVNTPAIGMAG